MMGGEGVNPKKKVIKYMTICKFSKIGKIWQALSPTDC